VDSGVGKQESACALRSAGHDGTRRLVTGRLFEQLEASNALSSKPFLNAPRLIGGFQGAKFASGNAIGDRLSSK
jgi:hypothetical protein